MKTLNVQILGLRNILRFLKSKKKTKKTFTKIKFFPVLKGLRVNKRRNEVREANDSLTSSKVRKKLAF